MMPHKTWEIGFLVAILSMYIAGSWWAVAKAYHSGWRWYYTLGAAALIVMVGTGLGLFVRSMRRI